MKDPLPENITGEKTVAHTVQHTVRWDYLLIAALAVYAVWKVGEIVTSTGSDSELVDGVEVEIGESGENNQVAGLRTGL